MLDVIVINCLCHGYIVRSSEFLVMKLIIEVKVVPNLNRA